MFTLILATLQVIFIIALNFVSVKQKLMLIAGAVISLVIGNFVNELSFHWSDSQPNWQASSQQYPSV